MHGDGVGKCGGWMNILQPCFCENKVLELAYFVFGSSCLHVCLGIILLGNIPILHFNLCMKEE